MGEPLDAFEHEVRQEPHGGRECFPRERGGISGRRLRAAATRVFDAVEQVLHPLAAHREIASGQVDVDVPWRLVGKLEAPDVARIDAVFGPLHECAADRIALWRPRRVGEAPGDFEDVAALDRVVGGDVGGDDREHAGRQFPKAIGHHGTEFRRGRQADHRDKTQSTKYAPPCHADLSFPESAQDTKIGSFQRNLASRSHLTQISLISHIAQMTISS